MKQKTMDILKYLSIGWCPKMAHNGSACLRSAFQTCLKKAWEQTKGILQTRSWTKFATQQSLQNACGNAEPLDKIRQFEERCKRANCRCGANFVQLAYWRNKRISKSMKTFEYKKVTLQSSPRQQVRQ